MIRLRSYTLPALLVLALGINGKSPAPDVVPNDNRVPAGRLHGDTLDIRLEVRMATWRPESDTGPSIVVAAFAETGQPARIPGPLIRIPTGTFVVATVTNGLADSTIAIHGLVTHPSPTDDSLVLHPGESGQVRFAAGAPGTYLYRAVLGKHALDRHLNDEREQVAGAFIVDPPGRRPPDRIFVIAIWGSRVDSAEYRPNDYRNAITINGRSWPWTERIETTMGDTLHWRWINASARSHPMHLHGFYYRVDSHGTATSDTIFGAADRRQVVTDAVPPMTTMTMSFAPDRPGNWLFHCHVGFHVVPTSRLNKPVPSMHAAMEHDPMIHMAGLAIGIRVKPAPGWVEPPREHVRHMRLFVQEGTPHHRAPRALSFVLQEGADPPPPDSVVLPGSALVLTRNEPTDITVINRLHEPTAIHWHGVELLSYSDGVAGWSGTDQTLAPSIMPGDSFIAHLSLPRAGTFMYHTHLNDLEQLSSGLYGPIIVLEPGQKYDPRHDHVFVTAWDGANPEPPRLVLNGDSLPPTLELAAGVPHRLRFINIGLALAVGFRIVQDTVPEHWRRLAKDGADLLPSQQSVSVASQTVNVGETYDFEFTPAPGEYRLVAATQGKVFAVQRIRVR